MVTSGHPHGCNSSMPVPHSWQGEGVCSGWAHNVTASGRRGAAFPEVAFLLHHEAITLPRRAPGPIAIGTGTAWLLSLQVALSTGLGHTAAS
ncbi:unnamed protein product, partial [Bubo scandiacus]